MKKIVKYGADYCAPCKIVDNVLKQLKDIDVEYVDIMSEDGREKAQELGLRSIPVLHLVSDSGEIIREHVGMISFEEICDWYK